MAGLFSALKADEVRAAKERRNKRQDNNIRIIIQINERGAWYLNQLPEASACSNEKRSLGMPPREYFRRHTILSGGEGGSRANESSGKKELHGDFVKEGILNSKTIHAVQAHDTGMQENNTSVCEVRLR